MAIRDVYNDIKGSISNGAQLVHSTKLNMAFEIGRGAMHATAPDDFEYYMCAFELFDSQYSQVGFLTFPVMPNNINETNTTIKTVTKTFSRSVTLFNSSFNPRSISIQGTFGRKFRLLLGCKEVDASNTSSAAGFTFGLEKTINTQTSPLIKTGYGVVKILKNILDLSDSLDNNQRPYMLVFHNYAFNTHYVVEVLQNSFSQSVENNTLWFYNVEMKAVAPASVLSTQNWRQFIAGGVSNKAFSDATSKVVNAVLRKTGGFVDKGANWLEDTKNTLIEKIG